MFSHKNGKYFSSDRQYIYYKSIGDEQSYPLIFLHGGLQNIKTFNQLLKFIAIDLYRIIGIDTNGYGRSTLNGQLTYQSIQKDVESILAHLGITQCSVIGHSDGGVVALRLALSEKIKTDKVVAIGAHWKADSDEQTIDFYQSLTAEKWQSAFPDEVKYYMQLNPAPDLSKLLHEAVSLWTDASDTGYPAHAVAQITCPTLIVRGDDDFMVSREHNVELARLIRQSHFLNLPFAGHSVHIDNAPVVGSLINTFLA